MPNSSPTHGDAAARWLVVYNLADSGSVAWADFYRQARAVPAANVLGLELPLAETSTPAQFAALDAAINAHLDGTGLAEQVLGVLLGYRVPGYVDFGAQVEAVPALLHARGSLPEALLNDLAGDGAPARPSVANLGGRRLTARIDGPTLAAAQALTRRALALEQGGLGDGATAALWLDPNTTPGPLTSPIIAAMTAWAGSLDAMALRVPLHATAPGAPGEDAQFAAIQDDGFFWGWSAPTPPAPPAGFFGTPAGARVFLLQLHTLAATAPTLRSAAPAGWVDGALAAGYAAAAGSCRAVSLSNVPRVRPFFAALRAGWTLAEAWLVACPVLRDGLFLAGDPLATVPLPRGGWDVLGPAARLEELDPTTPALALGEPQGSVALGAALRPAEGRTACYVVRHVDALGRAEAGAGSGATVRVACQAGRAARPALGPVWPDGERWPVLVEDGQAVLRVQWDRPIGTARVARVVLLREVDGVSETVQTLTPAPGQRALEVRVDLSRAAGRFAWQVVSPDGVVEQTPWSAPVAPASLGVMALRAPL